jgi:hypothetical protein
VTTILNKTHEPLRVSLPRGKKLHLGPGQTGQIAHQDLEHGAVKRLINEGKREVQDTGASQGAQQAQERAPHESTHGRQSSRASSQFKGER